MALNERVTTSQRFTKQHPCPVCHGYDGMRRSYGARCCGFISRDDGWVFCTREEYAGQLSAHPRLSPPTYQHKARGPCRCGVAHAPDVLDINRKPQWLGHGTSRTGKSASLQQPPQTLWDGSKLTAYYDYDGGDSTTQYRVLRYEKPGGDDDPEPRKRFLLARRVGSGWVMDIQGITRVLYRLTELRAAPVDQLVYLVEGEKCVELIRARGLVATCTSGGAGQAKFTPSIASELRDRHVVILPDNDAPDAERPDKGYVGQRHAWNLAEMIGNSAASVRILALPGLPDKGDMEQWFESGGTPEELYQLARQAPFFADWIPPWQDRASPPRLALVPSSNDWERPVPLVTALPPVAGLHADLLPNALREWLVDVAQRMQVPLEYVAVGAIVVAGSLIGRQMGIRPKEYDNWLVVPNLWGAIVGPPSALKSPALEEVQKPLERLTKVEEKRFQDARAKHEAELMVVDARRSTLGDRMKKAVKSADADELQRLREEAQAPSQKVPTRRRFKVNDGTVEKIAELLSENHNGLLVSRDELTGWWRSLEKLGREMDRPFYLEAWNETGSYDVDRIGRGSIHIPALCLSLLGGIQPGPLMRYVEAAVADDSAGNDGLLQRFQMLVWPDLPSSWRYVDRTPNLAAQRTAYAALERLTTLDSSSLGACAEPDDPDGIPFLHFSAQAQVVFREWLE